MFALSYSTLVPNDIMCYYVNI